MDSRDFALIEMLIFTGLALGLGVWQLLSVNRELKKTRAEEEVRKAGNEPPA